MALICTRLERAISFRQGETQNGLPLRGFRFPDTPKPGFPQALGRFCRQTVYRPRQNGRFAAL
jgi:hypothetical protein